MPQPKSIKHLQYIQGRYGRFDLANQEDSNLLAPVTEISISGQCLLSDIEFLLENGQDQNFVEDTLKTALQEIAIRLNS